PPMENTVEARRSCLGGGWCVQARTFAGQPEALAECVSSLRSFLPTTLPLTHRVTVGRGSMRRKPAFARVGFHHPPTRLTRLFVRPAIVSHSAVSLTPEVVRP